MSMRLKSEDRQAIDLLLERPDGHGDTPSVNQIFAKPVKGRMEKRLDSVERVLDLLETMPAMDPPADLLSRTLRRVEEASLEPTGALTPQQTIARDTRAHA